MSQAKVILRVEDAVNRALVALDLGDTWKPTVTYGKNGGVLVYLDRNQSTGTGIPLAEAVPSDDLRLRHYFSLVLPQAIKEAARVDPFAATPVTVYDVSRKMREYDEAKVDAEVEKIAK